MFSYLIRRILLIVPTLIGATALIFLVMAMAPGGIVGSLLSQEGQMRPGERKLREEYLNKRYGLNSPLPIQYLRWLNNISPFGFEVNLETRPDGKTDTHWKFVGFKTPDLGESFKRARPAAPVILEALPVTLMLQAISLPLGYAIAILSGIWTAKHRGKVQDVATGTFLLALWSLPVMWVGVMLIGFLANDSFLNLFPIGELHSPRADDMSFLPGKGGIGYLLDTAWHLVLPLICLTYGNFAFISKLTRASLLEALGQDFVRTARAKGLSERVVLFRHAFSNSLMSLITMMSEIFPGLFAGSIIVEKIFSISGMGRLTLDALLGHDRELFLSIATLSLLLQLVGFLVTDVLYAVADPRVSYD